MRRLTLVLALLVPAEAAGLEQEDATQHEPPVSEATSEGSYLPGLLPASTMQQAAVVRVLGGYDSSVESGVFDSDVRVRLFGPLTLRGGATFSERNQTLRPRIGAAVQVLSQGKQGVDGTVALSYKAEGFTEPEGELELEVAVGHRWGSVLGVVNLAYGQDPEGNERDGELRLGAQAELATHLHAGLAGTLRVGLGEGMSEAAMEERGELDVVVGPTVAYAFHHFALFAQAGLSVVQLKDESFHSGAVVVCGVGTAF